VAEIMDPEPSKAERLAGELKQIAERVIHADRTYDCLLEAIDWIRAHDPDRPR
jgi:hypothetical protein